MHLNLCLWFVDAVDQLHAAVLDSDAAKRDLEEAHQAELDMLRDRHTQEMERLQQRQQQGQVGNCSKEKHWEWARGIDRSSSGGTG